MAKISPTERAKIASKGHKLTLRFKRVDVHGLKGSISQEAKPDEQMEHMVPLLEEIAGPSNCARRTVLVADVGTSPLGISASKA